MDQENLDESALLEDALSDAPAEKPETTEEQDKQERARDEKGRFAKQDDGDEKLSDPAQATVTHAPLADKPAGEVVQKPEESHGIPSWRLAEEANARREAERRAQDLERRHQELERRLSELDKPKPQEPIDIFQDPDGFQQRLQQDRESLQQDFQKSLRAIQLENNLQIASIKHGDTFEKAYAAFQEASDRGDHATCQRIINSRNPGESMVKWYRDNETLKEVGNDPAAYRQKLLDEALNDDAFVAKVVEKIKGKDTNRPVTKLPPSLSKATSAAGVDEDGPPLSDKELLEHALR